MSFAISADLTISLEQRFATALAPRGSAADRGGKCHLYRSATSALIPEPPMSSVPGVGLHVNIEQAYSKHIHDKYDQFFS